MIKINFHYSYMDKELSETKNLFVNVYNKCIAFMLPVGSKNISLLKRINKNINLNNFQIFFHNNHKNNFCSNDKYIFSCLSLKKNIFAIKNEFSFLINKKINVVIHPGFNPKKKKGLDKLVLSLDYIFKHFPNINIHLENDCGKKNNCFGEFSIIEKFFLRISHKKYFKKVFFCLDTCHSFSFGYNLKQMINFIDKMFLIRNDLIKLIHLNDSKHDISSKKDRHAPLFTNIFKENDDFKKFINNFIIKKYDISFIIEDSITNSKNKISELDYYNNIIFNKK